MTPIGGRRVALAAAGLLLAGLTVSTGIARVQASRDPAIALSAWPLDARAKAAAGLRLVDATPTRESIVRARTLAGAALARDLTVSTAYATLGAAADVGGDRRGALSLMRAADSLSRRDLMPRLWLIQEAVDRGDVAGALGNFDVGLRTSPRARRILFPILAGALADPQVQPAIARLLDTRPAWSAEFIYAAANAPGSAEPLARVLAGMKEVPVYPGIDLRQLVVDTLVAQRNLPAAVRLGRGVVPAATGRAPVIDPDFRDDAGPTPVNWLLASESGLIAERSTDERGRPELSVTAPAGIGGTAASQILALPPGRYVLASTLAGDPRAGAPASWTVTCIAEGSEAPAAALDLAQPRMVTTFEVPAVGCPGQWLRLAVRGAETGTGTDFAVARVEIRPAR